MKGRKRELVIQRQPFSKLVGALPVLLVLAVVLCLAASTDARVPDNERIDLWNSFGGRKVEKSRIGTIGRGDPQDPFAQGGNENNDNSRSRRLKGRIIGGTPVADGEYPFYALPRGMLLCGATLIAPQILLTAAHCGGVWTSGALIGGTQITGQGSTPVDVDLEFPHPDYDTSTNVNDIMLVKLSEPISDTTPIQLNFDQDVPSDGEAVKVIGFGDTEPDGTFSDVLLQVGVEVFPFVDCNMYYGSILDDVMVCAGKSEGGRDACQGDSGGPLMTQNNVQIGVVSFGDSCGQPGIPAVYARVSGYQEWITQGVCELSDNPPPECLDTDSPIEIPVDPPILAPTTSTEMGQPTAVPVQQATSAPIIVSTTSVPTLTPVQVTPPMSIPSSLPLTLAPVPVPATTTAPTASDTISPIASSTMAPVPVPATTTAPTDPQPTSDTISPVATSAPAITPESPGSPAPVQSPMIETAAPQSAPVPVVTFAPQTTLTTPASTRPTTRSRPSKSKSKLKKKKTNKSKKSSKTSKGKSSSKIKTSSSSKEGNGKGGMSSSKSRKGSKARNQRPLPTLFSRIDVPAMPKNTPQIDYLFGEW